MDEACGQDGPVTGFALADVETRLERGLRVAVPDGGHDDAVPAERGDHDLNPGLPAYRPDEPPRRAAVLVPLIERAGEVHVILTRRTEHLPTHAGQISFPGGKVDDADEGPLQAALREAREEIGLAAAHVQALGYLDLYQTATGYRIVPAVGVVRPDFMPVADPGEVADVFEVPLAFLMDPANHKHHWREWQGRRRHFYAMPYQAHYIWGATAGIIRNLYDRAYR